GGKGVEQLLGAQQLGDGVREILVVVLVEVVRLGAKLIGSRVHDDAAQIFHVELVSHEVLGESVEQLVVGRGVGIAEVIDWIDNAAAEQVIPDAVRSEERRVGKGCRSG